MEITLHQYLKDSTRETHSVAESHPFQGTLASGKLPLSAYTDYLQQMQALHSAYEAKLAHAAEHDAHLKSVMRPEYYETEYLDRDLAALHSGPAAPLPCISEFIASENFDRNPVSMLGVLYVLLGSKHGGKFIAHSVKQAYEFKTAGYTYFSPYGENFRELWQQFTASLNGLNLTQQERESVLKAASDTFDIFGKIGQEVWRKMETSAASTNK